MSSEAVTRNDLKNILNELLPIFYPVGSYYETSDTTFNPNTEWGGTWELEVAGQVHVSSGTGYTVNGAETNESDGGAPTVTLNTTMIPAHTHGARLSNGSIRLFKGNQSTTASGSISFSSMTKRQYNDNGTATNSWQTATFALNHTHDSVGGGQPHENMPPYIVVNRWHRTA